MTRLDLVLERWKRQMRRFFFVELPAVALLLALALYVRQNLPPTAPAQSMVLATLACVIAGFAFISLWITRLPPHRPAPYDIDSPHEIVSD